MRKLDDVRITGRLGDADHYRIARHHHRGTRHVKYNGDHGHAIHNDDRIAREGGRVLS